MTQARKEYIRLLLRNVDVCTPVEPGLNKDATFNGELIDAGYVRGGVARNAHGVIEKCFTNGMTVEGRLFLDELLKKQAEESWHGRLQTWGVPILTYAAGIATPILSKWLETVLLPGSGA